MKLKPGSEYKIRLLNNPNEEKVVRFAVTGKEVKDEKGNLVFQDLPKEEIFSLPKTKFLEIPQNSHKLIFLTKDFCTPRGKKLILV